MGLALIAGGLIGSTAPAAASGRYEGSGTDSCWSLAFNDLATHVDDEAKNPS